MRLSDEPWKAIEGGTRGAQPPERKRGKEKRGKKGKEKREKGLVGDEGGSAERFCADSD